MAMPIQTPNQGQTQAQATNRGFGPSGYGQNSTHNAMEEDDPRPSQGGPWGNLGGGAGAGSSVSPTLTQVNGIGRAGSGQSGVGGGGMSALSALMRGGSGSGPGGLNGQEGSPVTSPLSPNTGVSGAGSGSYGFGMNGMNGMSQNQQQPPSSAGGGAMPFQISPSHHSPYGGPGTSFPNQPHNSPTFPSNLSPYAQPFGLPSTGYSYYQTGMPMSLTGMGSLLNNPNGFPGGSIGAGGLGMGGMGMSMSPQYGAHWYNQLGPGGPGGSSVGPGGSNGAGMNGGGGGMSYTHMGSFLGGRGQMGGGPGMMAMGSVGNDPSMLIGPGPAGSSVNSAMQHGPGGGWGVGGERSRELEKRYVRDFTCCGLKLGGLHDLLEHYEECHVHLAPDLRKQSMSIDAGANPENLIIPQNPAINAISSRTGTPSTSFPTASPFSARAQPVPLTSSAAPSMTTKQSSPTESDAPGTPGMMDIEMTMDDDDPSGVGIVGAPGSGVGNMPNILPPSSAQWTAFQQAQQPPPGGFPQCVEPSKLSYAIPGVSNQAGTASAPASKPGTPVGGLNGVNLAFNGAGMGAIGKPPRMAGTAILSPEQKAERAARKAAKKEARRIAKENGELSSDDGRDAEGFKKYRCPVPGCNKSYRQANGLKYHVQRSINSTHGHLVNVPLLPHPNHPDTKAHEKTAPV